MEAVFDTNGNIVLLPVKWYYIKPKSQWVSTTKRIFGSGIDNIVPVGKTLSLVNSNKGFIFYDSFGRSTTLQLSAGSTSTTLSEISYFTVMQTIEKNSGSPRFVLIFTAYYYIAGVLSNQEAFKLILNSNVKDIVSGVEFSNTAIGSQIESVINSGYRYLDADLFGTGFGPTEASRLFISDLTFAGKDSVTGVVSYSILSEAEAGQAVLL